MSVQAPRISVVYDSVGAHGFETGWGFSALIQMPDTNILFDSGWDGHMLIRNLARLGFHPAAIDKIVLSHMHWDHISGLPEIFSQSTPAKPIEVFLPKAFSERLKGEISTRALVTEVEGPCEVARGVLSTGVLGRDVKEQAVVVESEGKGLLLTGCAHPGVRDMMARALEVSRPVTLMGGLHGATVADMPEDLERVIPCHCTQAKEEILRAFGGRAQIGMAGVSYPVAP